MDAPSNSSPVSSSNVDSPALQLIAVPRSDRWQIYHRLKELEISCRLIEGKLEIAAHSFTDQIQVWSVIHQLGATRSQLASLLERSWAASA